MKTANISAPRRGVIPSVQHNNGHTTGSEVTQASRPQAVRKYAMEVCGVSETQMNSRSRDQNGRVARFAVMKALKNAEELVETICKAAGVTPSNYFPLMRDGMKLNAKEKGWVQQVSEFALSWKPAKPENGQKTSAAAPAQPRKPSASAGKTSRRTPELESTPTDRQYFLSLLWEEAMSRIAHKMDSSFEEIQAAVSAVSKNHPKEGVLMALGKKFGTK